MINKSYMTVVAEDKMMGMLTLCYSFILRPAIHLQSDNNYY